MNFVTWQIILASSHARGTQAGCCHFGKISLVGTFLSQEGRISPCGDASQVGGSSLFWKKHGFGQVLPQGSDVATSQCLFQPSSTTCQLTGS